MMICTKLSPLSEAEYKTGKDCKRKKAIQWDKRKIEEALGTKDAEKMRTIHMEIDGKYGAYVPDWHKGMFGYFEDFGFDHSALSATSLTNNLSLMKSKLEGYALGLEKLSQKGYSPSNSVNVNVSNMNEINVSVTFESVRQQIEDMTSLTDEETQEIKAKLDDLEKIVNSKDKKKTKWEKAKSILVWLADKSFDVGMALLPLLLKIQG